MEIIVAIVIIVVIIIIVMNGPEVARIATHSALEL